jgi:hypothetical protein
MRKMGAESLAELVKMAAALQLDPALNADRPAFEPRRRR